MLHSVSLYKALQKVGDIKNIDALEKGKIMEIVEIIQKYNILKASIPLYELITSLIEKTGIFDYLKSKGSRETMVRRNAIRTLLSQIFADLSSYPKISLEEYLHKYLLKNFLFTHKLNHNAVNLIPIEFVNGLEFPYVFVMSINNKLKVRTLCKFEEDILPSDYHSFCRAVTCGKRKVFYTSCVTKLTHDKKYFTELMSPVEFALFNGVKVITYSRRDNRNYRKNKMICLREPKQTEPIDSVSQNIINLKIGDDVLHELFGSGKIELIDYRNGDVVATVLFDKVGRKVLMLKYANLQLIPP